MHAEIQWVGRGLKIALHILDFGRTTFGATCTGTAKVCLRAAVKLMVALGGGWDVATGLNPEEPNAVEVDPAAKAE